MPIFEYACVNCHRKVERIDPSPLAQVVTKCLGKCNVITRHMRVASAPAITRVQGSKKPVSMSSARPPSDPNWKQRVMEGKSPGGSQLANRLRESQDHWTTAVHTAVGGTHVYNEMVKERDERAARGEQWLLKDPATLKP